MGKTSVYHDRNDNDLALLIKNGDHDAFTEVFNRYSAVLYVHAMNKLRNETDARDVVQEMFINLWARRDALNPDNNLSGYLYTAVRNSIFNLIKHQKVVTEYASVFSGINERSDLVTDHLIREKQFAAMLEAEIASLPPRMREVFELRRKQHLSNKQIAAQLGIAESTVADQMKKALRILRLRIGLILIVIGYLNG